MHDPSSDGPVVSRETISSFKKAVFTENEAMFDPPPVYMLTPAIITAHHPLASGPRAPDWAIRADAAERAEQLAADVAERRKNDNVDKMTIEELMAIDIDLYADA